MSRVLPYPLLTVSLLAMWLLLNGLSVGQVLLGGAIACRGVERDRRASAGQASDQALASAAQAGGDRPCSTSGARTSPSPD